MYRNGRRQAYRCLVHAAITMLVGLLIYWNTGEIGAIGSFGLLAGLLCFFAIAWWFADV